MRPKPITVAQLNSYMKNLVDRDEVLNNVYIKGEISNFKNHYSGHLYFTLKDETSLVKCVMFKTYAGYLNFTPKDGMAVVILGTVSVFERDGVYQIYVKGMEPDGLGALYKAYEELKEKLDARGMFDPVHKKSIPLLPKSIGVVTSKTGAVIRDIINVATRRFPNANIKLYPAAVQGKGAAETIVKGIKYFNDTKCVDVIIVARGGGSLEDLWPFNEEITALAIFDSELPIISAVGHETDFTIADFVADLRAPTPSAAAELAFPQFNDLKWKIQTINRQLQEKLHKTLIDMKNEYLLLRNSKAFTNPYDKIRQEQLRIDECVKFLINDINLKMSNNRIMLIKEVSALEALSPLKTLSRGYAIVEDISGNIVKSTFNLKKDDEIKLILSDGELRAMII